MGSEARETWLQGLRARLLVLRVGSSCLCRAVVGVKYDCRHKAIGSPKGQNNGPLWLVILYIDVTGQVVK